MAEAGKDEAGRKTSGSGASPDGAAKTSTPKMRTKKLTVDPSLTPAVTEPKPNFAFSNAGTFSEEDVKISQKGLEIAGSPVKPPAGGKPDWAVIHNLEELEDTGDILGRGSAGLVKRVVHKTSRHVFALKVIPLDISEDIRKKILLELRTLHNAFHPSIVTFYGAFYKEGAISICLELMNGGTLAEIIKGAPIPEPILAHIALKLLGGLHYIHKQLHLIHRDIKPQNLLVNTQGEVKITDFGVSGKIENTIGKAVSFVGTVTYMSPERIIGKQHSTVADIWSLGLTVLECALGYYPYFPPDKKIVMGFFQLLECIVQSPAPIPAASAAYSADFCNFVSRSLAKNPDERPDAASLMNHAWILKHTSASAPPADVAPWIQQRLMKLGRIKDAKP